MFVISYFSRPLNKVVTAHFATLDAAKDCAAKIFAATGVVVGIEARS